VRTKGLIPLLFAVLCLALPLPAAAISPNALLKGAEICRSAITAAERKHAIPRQLLSAVSVAETGRWHKAHQASLAWPWTVYAEGRGRYLPSKAAALAEIKALRKKGVRNIDIGCMQVNLEHHGKAFDSLDAMLDPATNAGYAARFLQRLHNETRSWSMAVSHYHSRTPELGRVYRTKVFRLWDAERRRVAEERRKQVRKELQRRRALVALNRSKRPASLN
jgi:soluble lytic murein transglycosylase-like protein